MAIQLTVAPWRYWAEHSPNQIALIHDGREVSWAQLAVDVSALMATLNAQGLSDGDVITVVGKNHINGLLLLLAVQELGVCVAFTMEQPASSLEAKLETLYHSSQSRYVWFNGEILPIEHLKLLNLRVADKSAQPSHYCSNYDASNLATIVFTSGSTGTPKAVAHTHAQHLSSAEGLLEKFTFTEQDSWLLSLPMYHVSGLAIVYRWLQAGATLKFSSGNLSEDIEGVTHASLVVTQLQRLIESNCYGNLTHVLLGGSQIPQGIAEKAEQQGIETWLGYGMTEAASTVTAKRVDAFNSGGEVLTNRDVRVVDGRIYIKGQTLASGYYQQGVLKPIVDKDGWFNTKDLGEWHGDELCIIGRADNQFISGGENIHCEEIEAALLKHSSISQAIVVPVEDSEFGHRPVAIVQTLKPLDYSELNAFLLSYLEKFKRPIAYHDMPDSANQGGIKISRAYLKQWLANKAH